MRSKMKAFKHTGKAAGARSSRKPRRHIARGALLLALLTALALGRAPLQARAAAIAVAPGDVAGLIAAIDAANANPNPDTITLATGTYSLTAVNNTTDGPNGLPSITSPITIVGNGAAIERNLPSSNLLLRFRIFHVAATGNLTLRNLTVRGGLIPPYFCGGGVKPRSLNPERDGGGIYSHGPLAVIDSTIQNNGSFCGDGGGIFSAAGTLTLTGSAISDNFGSSGGGIYSSGTLTLSNSVVSANRSSPFGYGDGGGIYVGDGAVATITTSSIIGNTTGGDGGGVYANDDGTLTLTNSTIGGNQAIGEGGGIYNRGALTLASATVTRNIADAANPLDPSHPDAPNGLGDGGGVASGTAGTDNLGLPPAASAGVTNSIIAANFDTPGNAGPQSVAADVAGMFDSGGHNLISDGSGGVGFSNGVNGDQVGTRASPLDARLAPLADNGGPTVTHALLPGSPAIDAGDPAPPGSSGSACPAIDQRGVTRPQGSACDIGAYERKLYYVWLPGLASGRT
jgi:hypothetical protein